VLSDETDLMCCKGFKRISCGMSESVASVVFPSRELAQLRFLLCCLPEPKLPTGLRRAAEEEGLFTSFSRSFMDVAKWTEEVWERVGEGGCTIEEPSMEETKVGEGEGGGSSRVVGWEEES
jgi:hypothetical protein